MKGSLFAEFAVELAAEFVELTHVFEFLFEFLPFSILCHKACHALRQRAQGTRHLPKLRQFGGLGGGRRRCWRALVVMMVVMVMVMVESVVVAVLEVVVVVNGDVGGDFTHRCGGSLGRRCTESL